MDERLRTIKVNIFGTEYPIKGEADLSYVNKLAEYVDEKMLDLTGGRMTSATVRLAVMAAFNIADELFQLKSDLKELKANPGDGLGESERIADLLKLLDDHVPDDA